jgi:hypothetical protein
VGLTAGGKITAGPPEANENGELLGPRCVDVSANGFVDIGAKVAFKFFDLLKVDASFKHPAYESPKLDLFKGPCWGYVGGVKYHLAGTANAGTYGCTGSGCPGYEFDQGVTIVMTPGRVARFNRNSNLSGIMVSQPHTWTAFNNTKHLGPDGAGGNCVTGADIGSGSGSYPDEFYPRPGFLHFDGQGYFMFGTWPSNPGTASIGTRYDYSLGCEGDRIDAQGWHQPVVLGAGVGRVENGGLNAGMGPAEIRTLNGTATFPEGRRDSSNAAHTVVYDLTRVEVGR